MRIQERHFEELYPKLKELMDDYGNGLMTENECYWQMLGEMINPRYLPQSVCRKIWHTVNQHNNG